MGAENQISEFQIVGARHATSVFVDLQIWLFGELFFQPLRYARPLAKGTGSRCHWARGFSPYRGKRERGR